MSKKVNVETGEVKVGVRTWRNPREGKALENSNMIIQHRDFAYDPETKGLKIIDTDLEDREAYIQSFADDCGVYNVLKKYSKTGDVSLLNVKEGFYADLSELPVDNLDPAAAQKAAAQALAGLNDKLGSNLTADQIQNMSVEELNAIITQAVQAAAAKVSTADDKKEGE